MFRKFSSKISAAEERLGRDIHRATRKQYSAEEKIRIVLDDLRGEVTIVELRRREGIAKSLCHSWSKEFLEAGKRRLAGESTHAATTNEVKDLRHQARELKEFVAEQAFELRFLKERMSEDGGEVDAERRAAMMHEVPSIRKARCLIPWFDGALFSSAWKDALWDRVSTAAPRNCCP